MRFLVVLGRTEQIMADSDDKQNPREDFQGVSDQLRHLQSLCREIAARMTEPMPDGTFPDIGRLVDDAEEVAQRAGFKVVPIAWVRSERDGSSGQDVIRALALDTTCGGLFVVDPHTGGSDYIQVFSAPSTVTLGDTDIHPPSTQLERRQKVARYMQRWVRFLDEPMEQHVAPTSQCDETNDEGRVVLDDENQTVQLPGERLKALTETQYRVIKKLIDAEGGWISGNALKEFSDSSQRIDYIIRGRPSRGGSDRHGGLPDLIRQHIESGGPKGYRWSGPLRA